MEEIQPSKYRWYILSLGVLSHIFAAAIPSMSMPVLFAEISEDLGLNLVQLGTVWGILSLAGLFASFIGGLLGDRYGTKRTLATACMLAGVLGGMRGLSNSFTTLVFTMFCFGFSTATISLITHKAAGLWFPWRQLGLANGILSTGMGAGMTVGSLISATVMSPLLGGWRNVLFLYGVLSFIIGILWVFSRSEPRSSITESTFQTIPFREALSHVARIKPVWMLALAGIFFSGCYHGLAGYLPLFLRNSGWSPVSADSALALFSALGMLGAIPLSYLSDRIGSRKAILIVAQAITMIGVGLLSVASAGMVWVIMIAMGIFREARPALMVTLIMELEGVGGKYAGTALGLRGSVGRLGGIFGPPVGNSFAGANPGLPFVFWAVLALISLVLLGLVKETERKKTSG